MLNKNVARYTLQPEKRKSMLRPYSALLKILRRKKPKKNEFDYYFSTPVIKNTIFISGLGRNVRGSMQYLLNELNSNDLYKDYKIFVRTDPKNTDEIVKGYIEQNGWLRTKAVYKGLPRYLESSEYLITESYLPYPWIKKEGQILIDLWHGTPLKRLGLLKSGDKCHKNAIQQKNFICADYLLYPNEFTKNVMWDSYKITSLLNAKALMMGYPRTAGILKAAAENDEDLHRLLAPNNEHVYAYMPTFRGNLSDEEAIARERAFLDYIDQNLRDDQILYVNLHHHIKDGLDCDGYKHIQLFPPLVDSYKILAHTEALISDYSSVFYDYLVLKKQIILFIEDIESYLAHHGLNIDIEQLPFDLARTKEDVIKMLNAGKQYDDTEYFNSMCGFDSADNPEKLCRLFIRDDEGLDTVEIPHNDKKKILLYTDCCVEGRDTDRLAEITEKYDHEKAEIYVSVDEYETSEHMNSAYPLLHNTLVIGTRNSNRLSSVGEPLLQLYKDGRIPFKTAYRFLNFEYSLISKRYYGDTVWDVLGIYDTVDPTIVLGFALSQAKNKVLFISDAVEKELNSNNKYLRDAIKYAAEYCCCIAVSDSRKMELMKKVLRKKDIDRLTMAGSADDVIALLDEINAD